jgi:hypothetical protein
MDFHYTQEHVNETETGLWNVLDWVIPLLLQSVSIKERNVLLVGTDMAYSTGPRIESALFPVYVFPQSLR